MIAMDPMLLILILLLGVMGFGGNFVFRVFYIFCEIQDGNEIDWRYQALITFLVPCAYLIAMLEVFFGTGIILVP